MELFNEELMNPLFCLLEKTKGLIQMEEHHPEGDVLTHSLQVLKWAFRESYDTDLILAAMLHDVGKAVETKGHDKVMSDILRPLVSPKTLWLVEQHMRIWYFLLGEMKKLSKVRELAESPWLPELISLARWDKLGRNPHIKHTEINRELIMERLNKCIEKRFEINAVRAETKFDEGLNSYE